MLLPTIFETPEQLMYQQNIGRMLAGAGKYLKCLTTQYSYFKGAVRQTVILDRS